MDIDVIARSLEAKDVRGSGSRRVHEATSSAITKVFFRLRDVFLM